MQDGPGSGDDQPELTWRTLRLGCSALVETPSVGTTRRGRFNGGGLSHGAAWAPGWA